MSVSDNILNTKKSLPEDVTLVAVSKTHPEEKIMEAYNAGQRIFGESKPQELRVKYDNLPKDIEWHFIGGLQTNKVKYIAPYVSLIHSADSARLLQVIQKEAARNGRTIDVLLEIHVAREESKQGWEIAELHEYLSSGEHKNLPNVRFRGVMGMATYTDDELQIRKEFTKLRDIFKDLKARFFTTEDFDTMSMGMSGDYRIAIECGSNMVRIGSSLFGGR